MLSTAPSLLAFGAQTTWPSRPQAIVIRDSLLRSPYSRSMVQAIHELRFFWQTLVSHDPSLDRAPALAAISTLQRWLTEGGVLELTPEKGDASTSSLPNVLSTPLTVLVHIGLYFQYLHDHAIEGLTHEVVLRSLKYGGAQGLCAGILSALVCASSENEAGIGDNAAIALRLALALGAYVDVDGSFSPDSTEYSCFVLRWKSELGKQKCNEILETYQEVSSPYPSADRPAT